MAVLLEQVDWANEVTQEATRQLGWPVIQSATWHWRVGSEIETDYFELLAEKTGLPIQVVQDRITELAIAALGEDSKKNEHPVPVPKSSRPRLSPEVRQAVIDRDGLVCGICAEVVRIVEIHIDHIYPRSKGGGSELDNLRVTHARCNTRKGSK